MVDAAGPAQKQAELGDAVGDAEAEALIELRGRLDVGHEQPDMAEMGWRGALIAGDAGVDAR